jgi:hypothetical protein
MNFFSTFSYFENKVEDGYLSLFPSTKCKFTKEIPANGKKVFQINNDNQFYQKFNYFLQELKKNNFGFNDFFFLLKYSETYSAQEIIEFYKSLYYSNGIIENEICKIEIKSNILDSYCNICYLKDTSLPQEALDTFVFFCNDSKQIYTALGNKRKSDLISINFVSDKINLLKTSLYGTVIIGEHLEQNEKKEINESFNLFELHKKIKGQNYMKLNSRDAKPSMRALAEEFGLESNQFNFDTYIIGKDTRDNRDPRYWTFGNKNEYGYQRKSESLMIILISKCNIPSEIPDPQDIEECSKGVIVSVDYALKEFSETGKLKCAFPSHPVQFKMCTTIINDIIKK